MVRYPGRLLIAIVLMQPFATPARSLAQSDATTFHSGIDIVALSVTVKNRDGSFVRKLDAEQFHVFENGVEQTISVFGAGEIPVDLVLMLDTSGSMSAKLSAAEHAALVLVNSLSERDRAGIFSFGGRINELADLTTDRQALGRAIKNLGAGGTTPLYDALYVALRQLGKPRSPDGGLRRRALVVLSDGEDTSSHVSYDSVLELARQAGVEIYVVMLRTPPYTEADALADYEMKTLARETGAQAFFPGPTENLDGVYASIATELANQYSVGYISNTPIAANTPSAHRFIRTTVVVDRRDAVVRARSGYVPGN
jgi:Ca-activated chloride channel family protein